MLGGTKAANFSISAVPDKGWLVVSHRSPPDPWGWGGPGAIRAAFVNLEGKPENLLKEESPQTRLPNWLDMGREKSKTATWPWATAPVRGTASNPSSSGNGTALAARR